MEPIQIGAKVTSIEVICLPGDKPRLAITADNPDGKSGFFSVADRSDKNSLANLDLEVIRGSELIKREMIDQDLVMEFRKGRYVSVLKLCNVIDEFI